MQDDIFKNSRTLRRTISVHSIFGFGFFQVSKNQQSRIKYPAFCLVFCDKGRINPVIWEEYKKVAEKHDKNLKVGNIDRFEFYERAKNAYAVIATGEAAVYANIILKKGVI